MSQQQLQSKSKRHTSIQYKTWVLICHSDHIAHNQYRDNYILMLMEESNIKSQNPFSVRYRSAPNIALIKYWGKFHESEILPINDSIGLTLNTDDLCTITSCSFSQEYLEDELQLNGKRVQITKRMKKVFEKIRLSARVKEEYQTFSQEQWSKYHFKVVSENSFPTASGMASSASGFSCMASALNALFGSILDERQLSRLARWGSGSAARAVYGGLVKWQGVDQPFEPLQSPQQLQQLSKKCISYSIRSSEQLSFIKVIILLTQNKEKDVSSTDGMKRSIQTSELIKLRNPIAKARIAKIEVCLDKIKKSRLQNNKEQEFLVFSELAQLIIRDSNQFHAICMDTYPPIFYMNEFSKSIVSIVDNIINTQTKKCKVAYSFDAGAHAFLFVHEDMLEEVLHYIQSTFELDLNSFNSKAQSIICKKSYSSELYSHFQGKVIKPTEVWVTDVGRGAEPVIDQQ